MEGMVVLLKNLLASRTFSTHFVELNSTRTHSSSVLP